MRVIETTAHTGSDGMLRLEVPLDQPDRDVRIALVVESFPIEPKRIDHDEDRWAAIRAKAAASGIRIPLAGVNLPGPVEPIDLPGPTASEILISDRA